MKLDISAGRKQKGQPQPDISDHVSKILLRSEGGADPYLLAALGRVLTGKEPEIADAISDVAKQCLKEWRARQEPRHD